MENGDPTPIGTPTKDDSMNRDNNGHSESSLTLVGTAALAVVPLAIAALLLYVLYISPNAKIAEAKSWEEVPCEVLHVEMYDGSLDIVYRYEYQGQEYESDRYDLMIGVSGEDDWARDAVIRLKNDPKTVCYVNPGRSKHRGHRP